MKRSILKRVQSAKPTVSMPNNVKISKNGEYIMIGENIKYKRDGAYNTQ